MSTLDYPTLLSSIQNPDHQNMILQFFAAIGKDIQDYVFQNLSARERNTGGITETFIASKKKNKYGEPIQQYTLVSDGCGAVIVDILTMKNKGQFYSSRFYGSFTEPEQRS